MIENGFVAAEIMGRSLLLLDRYYLSATALEKLTELNKAKGMILDIVTKAKASVVAYTKPDPYKDKGRPRKKGAAVKLQNLFTEKKDDFIETAN